MKCTTNKAGTNKAGTNKAGAGIRKRVWEQDNDSLRKIGVSWSFS